MDEEDEQIARSVAKNGWHAISVSDGFPPFVYTCGLQTTFEHPELILFGLDALEAYRLVSTNRMTEARPRR